VARWPEEEEKVSSGQIADAVGVSDAQVRRDLAALGHLGQRGVGYDARELAAAIRTALGIDRDWRAVLVGVGNLGRALLKYRGFHAQGFEIVALFDCDPAIVGQEVEGLRVEPVANLVERVVALNAELGVVTVPAESAHVVADAFCAGGIRGILNFAPVVLKLPRRIRLVTVDLAIQLEQLAFQVQHGDAATPNGRVVDEE
jgi:redox-sensing transcriptional repressor